jgi:hypothetical protein
MRLLPYAMLLPLLLPVSAWSQTQQNPDYVLGYQAWRETQYPDASTRLSRYRLEPYGRTYDVDYWLGTSWCRIAGRETAGASLLDWAYRYQSMPDVERGKFEQEREACLRGRMTAPQIIQLAVVPRATSRAEGKIYYLAGRRDGIGLNAAPLRLTRPLPLTEYAARVFPEAQLGMAKAATAARVPSAKILARGRFVLASLSPQHSMAELDAIAARLEHFVGYLDREYGIKMPDAIVTVYMVPTSQVLVMQAMRLHGIAADPATLGYSFQNDLSVVGILTGTAAGTLLHEMFHLAVRADFGDIPQFLDEGMAALYETSGVAGGKYNGMANWRGQLIRAGREVGAVVPLKTVIASPWFPDEAVTRDFRDLPKFDREQQGYVLSVSRYFLIWMQQRNLLPALYKAMRDRPTPTRFMPADQVVFEILEQVNGMPMAAIEAQFQSWLAAAATVESGRPLPQATGPAGELINKEIPRELIDRPSNE